MTRKGRQRYTGDEELKLALKDDTKVVHYNPDGTYDIQEIETDSPKHEIVEYVDNFNDIYYIYHTMEEYCRSQGLPILDDLRGFEHFCDLLRGLDPALFSTF